VETLPDLAEDAELALFRGVQEGLSNVARHADASNVTISVNRDGESVAVILQDDGQGLKTTEGTVALEERTGLAGMRERFAAQGGRVTLEPTRVGGLRLTLWLPAGNGDHR
jgi:two-component system sensor histidine kinase UhpB